MKKWLIKTFFATCLVGCLFATNGLVQKATAIEDPHNGYTMVGQKEAFQFNIASNNPAYFAEFSFDAVSVETNSYLGIEFEGNNNPDTGVEIALNGGDYLIPNVFGYSPTIPGWTPVVMYGPWFFIPNSRGFVYIPLVDCGSPTEISKFKISGSDNRNELFFIHSIFLCEAVNDTTGKTLMNPSQFTFTNSIIDDIDVTINGNVEIKKVITAEGCKSNKSREGGLYCENKTTYEITLPEAVSVNGGYFAYDVFKETSWAYYQVSYQNSLESNYSGSFGFNKTLSSNNVLAYADIISEFGFTKVNNKKVMGTVFEPVPTAAIDVKKIFVKVDNYDSDPLILSNFAYISADFTTVTPLIDFKSMDDATFASVCPQSTHRAPCEDLMDVTSVAPKASLGYSYTFEEKFSFENIQMRMGVEVAYTDFKQLVKYGNLSDYGFYVSTIDSLEENYEESGVEKVSFKDYIANPYRASALGEPVAVDGEKVVYEANILIPVEEIATDITVLPYFVINGVLTFGTERTESVKSLAASYLLLDDPTVAQHIDSLTELAK